MSNLCAQMIKFFVQLSFKKVGGVWGAECPVDIRPAPTGAKRRPTSHKQKVRNYCKYEKMVAMKIMSNLRAQKLNFYIKKL